MGFFSGAADFFDYMINGENSASARKMHEEKETLESKRVIGQVARKAAARAARAKTREGWLKWDATSSTRIRTVELK